MHHLTQQRMILRGDLQLHVILRTQLFQPAGDVLDFRVIDHLIGQIIEQHIIGNHIQHLPQASAVRAVGKNRGLRHRHFPLI
jgi:hypothetical protein